MKISAGGPGSGRHADFSKTKVFRDAESFNGGKSPLQLGTQKKTINAFKKHGFTLDSKTHLAGIRSMTKNGDAPGEETQTAIIRPNGSWSHEQNYQKNLGRNHEDVHKHAAVGAFETSNERLNRMVKQGKGWNI